jgi:hypothetical protein
VAISAYRQRWLSGFWQRSKLRHPERPCAATLAASHSAAADLSTKLAVMHGAYVDRAALASFERIQAGGETLSMDLVRSDDFRVCVVL